jgi:hypothetical protein
MVRSSMTLATMEAAEGVWRKKKGGNGMRE